MLLAIFPATDVLVSIRPYENTFTVLLAIFEVTFVLSAIVPGLDSSTFHVTHSKLSFVPFIKISKEVSAKSLELTIKEVTLIEGSILPLESTFAILLAFVELA
jgi:hypothetical protein